MSNFVDFVIQADQLDNEKISHTILQRLFLKRIHHNKPAVLVLVGDSGEGKSHTALRLCEVFSQLQGFDFKDYVNDVTIYTPLEYPTKFKALLEDPRLKKVNFLIIDEAREVVSSSQWNSFVNHAIADINATFRGVKPMIIIVVVQYLKDLDFRIRRTANYYGSCLRPLGKKVKLLMKRVWKDDSDIENPRLRTRGIRGFIVKNKRYQAIRLKPFSVGRVSREVEQIYELNAKQAKSELIKHKLNELMKELEKEYGKRFTRIEAAATYYVDQFENVTERVRGKIRLKKDLVSMLDFDKIELAQFEKKLIEKARQKGVLYGLVETRTETATEQQQHE